MENATKALLILAGVLLVIVIIALGIRVLGSVNDTSTYAQIVSSAIKDKVADISIDLGETSQLERRNFSIKSDVQKLQKLAGESATSEGNGSSGAGIGGGFGTTTGKTFGTPTGKTFGTLIGKIFGTPTGKTFGTISRASIGSRTGIGSGRGFGSGSGFESTSGYGW